MTKNLAVLLLLICLGCHTAKIKNEDYKFSSSTTELGSIGTSAVTYNKTMFSTKAFPQLENPIRLEIGIVPYNKKLNKIYNSKAKFNQNQQKIAYIDSLPVKPEVAIIKILDFAGLVKEINSDYNSTILQLLINNQSSKIVSSIAVNVSADEISKIKQADAFYLSNNQYKKYVISLYKSGKKTEIIAINPESIVAYQLSSFCWSVSERGNWYIADIVSEYSNCKGSTQSKISDKKKTKSLFDI